MLAPVALTKMSCCRMLCSTSNGLLQARCTVNRARLYVRLHVTMLMEGYVHVKTFESNA